MAIMKKNDILNGERMGNKMAKNNSLQKTIGELEDLFEIFNYEFFNGELNKPVITVSPDMTKGAYGWCTSYKAWKSVGGSVDGGFYEINICAEHLARSYEDVAGTMLHEMIHLYNLENGVKDCSRGGTYHNKRFKEAAENHGLVCELDSKYGWVNTRLNAYSLNTVREYMETIGKTSFDLFRESAKDPKKPSGSSSSRKYTCPCCGLSVRATKEVRIKCFDCDELMIQEA